MISTSLIIFTKIKKIRYLFYLIVQYLIDYAIPEGIKNLRTNVFNIKEWQELLIKAQPILELLQVNNEKGEILHRANYIMDHDFILFGKKYSFLPEQSSTFGSYQKINWHYDPSTKSEFPKKGWYRLVRKKLPKGSDLKYPWELSRFQHLILLGQAYADTNEEKYTLEFINQISDWIENNPVRYGINWSNTMEVGIRAANWTTALLFFIKSRHITKEFLKQYFKSIQEHGNHIYQNLENLQPINSNHYIGNLFGLYILSSICPFLNGSSKWLKFSKKELEKEIIRQTDKDGWDYEASTAYHRLVTEMFLYSYIIAQYFDQPFSNTYVTQLKKMIKVMHIMEKSDHTIPQIGDNDSGFSLCFDFDNDNLNFSNLSLLAQRNSLLTLEEQKSGFFIYEDAGYYIYKNDGIYLLVTTGPKELLGLGSHAHNDILSFILNVNGKDILVDPGSFVYTSDPTMRNQFRSVLSHNTLFWDGLEPRSLNDGLFRLKETSSVNIESIKGNDSELIFRGRYNQNQRYHIRSLSIKSKEKKIYLVDEVSHEDAILRFNFNPDNIVETIPDGFKVDNVSFNFDSVRDLEIQDSLFSPSYGQVQSTKSIDVFLDRLSIDYQISY